MALAFALLSMGALLHVITAPTLTTIFFALSLFVTALVIVRAAVWLWADASFWHVGYKRAEVCVVPALILGLLATLYYTPPSDDPYAVTKFIITAEVLALFVYLGVRMTCGPTNQSQSSQSNKVPQPTSASSTPAATAPIAPPSDAAGH